MNLQHDANRVRLQRVYEEIRPVCESVMAQPSVRNIEVYIARTTALPDDVVQEFQQYLLFPFITYIGSKEVNAKRDVVMKLVEAVRNILERVSVNSFEMVLRSDVALIRILFADEEPGKLADDVPEELKLAVMKTLTQLQLSLENSIRLRMLKEKVALLAQIVYVSVQYAKDERLRPLRLAAINCALAHTMLHPKLTNERFQLLESSYETYLVDMIGSILPGVMSGLQEVANCKHNPGHVIVVAALEAIHRILCLTMNDKYLNKDRELTENDFAKMAHLKIDVINKVRQKPEGKNIAKRTPEWFEMAGDKLLVITRSLVELRLHEHFKVRREISIYCARVLMECNGTMHRSIGLCLDVLFALSMDENPKVSKYCQQAVQEYFSKPDSNWHRTMDHLCENFFGVMYCLPRVLNNIDENRKVSALSIVHQYVVVLCSDTHGRRLQQALAAPQHARAVCHALLHAASLTRHLPQLQSHHADPQLVSGNEMDRSPWARLRHLQSAAGVERLQAVCRLLGGSPAARLLLDELLDMFQLKREPEVLYIINYIASAPNSPPSVVHRVLEMYTQEDVWYLPTVVELGDVPLTKADTLDPSVYNPRAWEVERVPDLYEGTVMSRSTDVPLQLARSPGPARRTARAARDNLLLCCLLVDGTGLLAERLGIHFHKYLLKTLCMVLERVGSKHGLLSLAGRGALSRIATAGGHPGPAQLIHANADYITYQVTCRLKKEWNSQSALQILSVVMEYSDESILDCLYDIVQNVLIQSCDRYYERDLTSYLTVFLTFIKSIKKWFKIDYDPDKYYNKKVEPTVDVTHDLLEFVQSNAEVDRLLSEKTPDKSAKEMYKEDQIKKEQDVDYDETVTEVASGPPRHVEMTVSLLKRAVHFMTSQSKDETILAFIILEEGLPILKEHSEELLPLVHAAWAGLAARFEEGEAVLLRRSVLLFRVAATLTQDFIRQRAVKDVLPYLLAHLETSATNSYLKDRGTAYRTSAAFNLQLCCLRCLPHLVSSLRLPPRCLLAAASAAEPYLSRKQPKPLQILSVSLFKMLLHFDYGATWYHLRTLCNNDKLLKPPTTSIPMITITGSPNFTKNKDYENNIKLIFDLSS